jgi:hypothetical protein
MAHLSWNEIKTRAFAFVNEWKDKAQTAREEADAQTFENGFFNIFGVSRSKVAIFEKKVKMKDGIDDAGLFGDASTAASGYIDLLWKGHILIEMKTPGKDRDKAYQQAKGYAHALPPADLPKGILICDFVTFDYYDLENGALLHHFSLEELPDHSELFGYLAGYTPIEFKKLDPVNIEAAEKMGKLHDRLKEVGYSGHQLEIYLVRLLFCLFADDTDLFEHDHLITYLIQRTNPDGSDLALHIEKIFEVLNKPKDKRLKTIDQQLDQFPFINGRMFEEHLEIADFDSKMRDTLIECCTLDWSLISPAIFGAMFQSVMNADERHDIGAHYTSEENIMKVINPLFMDGLWVAFERIKALTSAVRTERLNQFHDMLASLKFLDPACGCGNFLIISYRELRLSEIEVIAELMGKEKSLDVDTLIRVNVNQFYGIEIEEFPAKIAETAMWLMDHLMNIQVRKRFGQYYERIPLTTSATIVNGNALSINWESIVPKAELSYILGNPPFLGYSIMSKEQKKDVENVFNGMKSSGILDYVTCWYKKAAEYLKGTIIEVAFVSTNSICQGEQVPILWAELMNKHGITINFAHQTFKWHNEARGKAAVHCVIVGFSLSDRKVKKIYHYTDVTGKPIESIVAVINAYLINGPTVFIEKRRTPLCNVPIMMKGSMPNDGGYLLLNEDEKNYIAEKESDMLPFVKRFVGSYEFINNITRYCFWFKGSTPQQLRKNSLVTQRLLMVKAHRESSARGATQKSAAFPTLFGEIRQPDTDYLLIPSTSSEKRAYLPIGFIDKDTISSNANLLIPHAGLYHFGVLTATMHMAWMRHVCGRLEVSYRYSASIVYNNFPWPQPDDKQKVAVETAAQAVLDARALFPDSSLADLYDPLTMPPALVQAHQWLDQAVERAYGRIFANDAERVAYLFELYQKVSGELFAESKKRGKGRKAKS